MRYRYFCLLVFILSVPSALNCYGQTRHESKIDEPDIKLSQLVNNNLYDLDKTIYIESSNQLDVINNFVDIDFHKGIMFPENEMCACCIQAFVQWCNKFLGEDRNYMIFRRPYPMELGEFDESIWKRRTKDKIEADSNQFKTDKSDVVFDPFYDSISMNKYLSENTVIIVVSWFLYLSDKANVILDVLAPYKNEYYRFQDSYEFLLQIDFEKFSTKNFEEISHEVKQIIANDPSMFIDNEGTFKQMYYLENYEWRSYGNKNIIKMRLEKFDPANDKITLKTIDEGRL